MSESESSAPPELPEEGSLSDLSLPRLLLSLHRRRFDGWLVLGSGRNEKRFSFERGAPVLAESNLASEALGSKLVEKGVLSSRDHLRVCRYVKEKRCREGVALLALELLGPKDLFLALKDQVRCRMIDCFGWPDGQFRIEPAETSDEAARAFRCDPLRLTQEGLETHWSIERMLENLTPRLERFPIPTERFSKHIRRLQLDAEHESLLASLDGTRSLGVALGPIFGAPQALAAVWVLDALDALEYREEPAGGDANASNPFDSEIEIMIEGEACAGKPAARSETDAASSSSDPAGYSDRGAALRAEIDKLGASLGELDHYQILGVAPDAKAGVIKKAYFRAAKQYHPDTLVRLGLEDLREQASEVFGCIAEAFEVLTDPQQRKDYDAELRGELSAGDAARLAQAETAYRKGEILLRMGDFVSALEYLTPAVETWPEEPVYQSALGWALFKQPKTDLVSARGHLIQAVRLGPEDATAHMRLAMVLRALGQSQEADKIDALARSLNPGTS